MTLLIIYCRPTQCSIYSIKMLSFSEVLEAAFQGLQKPTLQTGRSNERCYLVAVWECRIQWFCSLTHSKDWIKNISAALILIILFQICLLWKCHTNLLEFPLKCKCKITLTPLHTSDLVPSLCLLSVSITELYNDLCKQPDKWAES